MALSIATSGCLRMFFRSSSNMDSHFQALKESLEPSQTPLSGVPLALKQNVTLCRLKFGEN